MTTLSPAADVRPSPATSPRLAAEGLGDWTWLGPQHERGVAASALTLPLSRPTSVDAVLAAPSPRGSSGATVVGSSPADSPGANALLRAPTCGFPLPLPVPAAALAAAAAAAREQHAGGLGDGDGDGDDGAAPRALGAVNATAAAAAAADDEGSGGGGAAACGPARAMPEGGAPADGAEARPGAAVTVPHGGPLGPGDAAAAAPCRRGRGRALVRRWLSSPARLLRLLARDVHLGARRLGDAGAQAAHLGAHGLRLAGRVSGADWAAALAVASLGGHAALARRRPPPAVAAWLDGAVRLGPAGSAAGALVRVALVVARPPADGRISRRQLARAALVGAAPLAAATLGAAYLRGPVVERGLPAADVRPTATTTTCITFAVPPR